MAEVCDCEFDPYEDGDPEESYHFKRTCEACGEVWWGLHCPHDGIQNPCPRCNVVPAGGVRPMEALFPRGETPTPHEEP